MTTVAIHQPNFFPWLGFFDKISRSDIFIILDDVQFPKTGGTWTNRVQLIVAGKNNWITAPMSRNYHGVLPINQIEFSTERKWRDKILKTILLNYSKAPFFYETMDYLAPLIENKTNNVAEFNTCAILETTKRLGISPKKIRFSSQLAHYGNSNERLISLTLSVGANCYMCGGGAQSYQDENLFTKEKIVLKQQNFLPSPYRQFNTKEFVPGLSIIDALMNLGFKGTNNFINKETMPHVLT